RLRAAGRLAQHLEPHQRRGRLSLPAQLRPKGIAKGDREREQFARAQLEQSRRERQLEGGSAPSFREGRKNLVMKSRRAWARIVARVLATGLALLGLAGIGWAARSSGQLGALSAAAPLPSIGLAQMLGSASVARAQPGPPPRAPLPCAPAPSESPSIPSA